MTKKATPNFEEDAAASTDSNQLQKVVNMANAMIAKETTILNLQDQIATLQKEYDELAMEQLPDFMTNIGMKEFSLSNGNKVVIKPIIRGSIPSESAIDKERDPDARATKRDRFERALAYLEKAKAGAMIKNVVQAELGKDSKALAKKVLMTLRKLNVEANLWRGVHPQTLNSWIRERIEAGSPVDMDLFQVFCGKRAEIVQPKAAKAQKAANKAFI